MIAKLSKPLLALLLFSPACTNGPGANGPQAGGQAGDPGEPPCGAVSEAPIQPDEATPLGFTANDALAVLEGAYQGSLTWDAGADSDITVWLENAREFRLVDMEPAPADEGEAEEECTDRIEMQFDILFTTAAGEFDEASGADEHVRATAVASDEIELHAEFATTALGGSYDVAAEVDPAIVDVADPPYLIVSGTLAATGLTGAITLSFRSKPGLEFPDGSTATAVDVGSVSASRLP